MSEAARKALSQARRGALLIASSNPVKDDEVDPPCIRAKREYEEIANACGGRFRCVGEHPTEKSPDVLEVEISRNGPTLRGKALTASSVSGAGAVGRQPLAHGDDE